MSCNIPKPDYKTNSDEFYFSHLKSEYTQCVAEGLDFEKYGDLIEAINALEPSEEKAQLGDTVFRLVQKAAMRDGYMYREPSDLEGIKALRKEYSFAAAMPESDTLKEKIEGAWLGRAAGCLLGKPVECCRTNELIPFLKNTGNYPMHRYILSTDASEEECSKYKGFNFRGKCYADVVDGMPVDDDTNYTVLGQYIVDRYGRNFTAADVAKAWVEKQSIESYFTAERVAYRNIVNGFTPPETATYKNPYREWIGAQIRADYYGYINPGKPEEAAAMAYNDACISHVKNGIYGEMFVAAMIACAAVTNSIKEIILGGLAQIPHTSRLYEAVTNVLNGYESGVPSEKAFEKVHEEYDEHTGYGWCHTISNAMIVAAALLYGEGDFGKSICLAVQTGFDTDCNAATVGSVLGMRNGKSGIPEEWTKPLNNKIHTSIFGIGTVKISDCAEKTMEHIK